MATMNTPRRALGDVKNVVGSAAKPFGSAFKQQSVAKPLASTKKVLDFEVNDDSIDSNKNSGDLTPKKEVESVKRIEPVEQEESLPIEYCTCNHNEHRSEEKYTLLDHETEIKPISEDVIELDEWLTYYYAEQSKIKSWRQYLIENDFV